MGLEIANFYCCLRWTLLFCTFIGLLPVRWLHKAKSGVKYSWKTPLTVVIIPLALLHFSVIIIKIYDAAAFDTKIIKFVRIILVVDVAIMYINYIHFASKFEEKFEIIQTIEAILPPIIRAKVLLTKIRTIFITIVILTLVENILLQLCITLVIKECYSLNDVSDGSIYQIIISYSYEWFFDHFPFNYVYGFIFHMYTLHKRLICSITDAIIIICAVYLKSHVKTFNSMLLRTLSGQTVPSWSDIRIHYTIISRLIRTVDEMINPFMFLSFFYNSISLCMKFYYLINSDFIVAYSLNLKCPHSFKPEWPVLALYSFYDFSFLICKIIAIIYSADKLNVLGKKSLKALHTIPSSVYDNEAQQFFDQVYHSQLSLSAGGVFMVNRKMMLTMLATLVTYELMLLQFRISDIA